MASVPMRWILLVLVALAVAPASAQDAEIVGDVLLGALDDDAESECVLTDTESPLFWFCVVPTGIAVAVVTPGLVIKVCNGEASRPSPGADAEPSPDRSLHAGGATEAEAARPARQRRGVVVD